MKPKFIFFLFALFIVAFQASSQVKNVKYIVMVGFDGFGAYAYPEADCPNLKGLAVKGAMTLKGRSVLPSSSAVNWASMLMGASPTFHGYTEWGSKTPEILSATATKYGMFPSIFSVIRDQKPNAVTAVIYSWEGIGYLFEKDAVNIKIATNSNEEMTADSTAAVIKRNKPMLTFVHFDQPDSVGHESGHNTPDYYNEITKCDRRLGKIIEATKEAGIFDNTLFIVTSDHGGIKNGHGGKTLNEVEIIWVISGPGVKQNYVLQQPLITYDTAATIAWVLGLQIPEAWRGKPVKEAFK